MTFLKYKKLSFFSLISILSIGLFLPSSSEAWMGGVDAWIVKIVEILVSLWFAVGVSGYLLRMSNGFLGWVTDPNFITDVGGYTQNILVQEGWQITRDLVNMFFILIMVGIGIATILRVKGYEIKKLLPKAIIIILLINFTPIICGLIIDASNILTNFFLSAGTRGTGDMIIKVEAPQNSLGGQIISFIKAVVFLDWTGIALSMYHFIMTLVFNLFASFILLALGMIFMMRYIMLWILIILSPLAFFCYILPSTKKIWDMWWKQFIQWCFIGIGVSFFLYLTQRIIDIIGSGTFVMDPGAEGLQMGDSGLVVIFVYLVPLIFLAAGFMATTMFAPKGAKQILDLAKKGAKWPTSKKGKETRAKFKDWRQGKARRVAGPKVQKAMSKLEGYQPSWGQDNTKGTKAGRWASRRAANIVGGASGVATTLTTKKIFGEGAEAQTGEIDKYKNEADKFKTPEARRAEWVRAKRQGNKEKQIGILQSAVDKKEIDGYSKEEIKDTIKKAGKINKKLAQKIMQVSPDLAQELYDEAERELTDFKLEVSNAARSGDKGKENKFKKKIARQETMMQETGLRLTPEEQTLYGSLEEKIVLTMKTKDIDKLNKNYVTNKNNDPNNKFMEIVQDVRNHGRSAWGGNKLGKMADEFEAPAVERYNEITDTQDIDNWRQNSPASKWIESSPGAYAAGYRAPTTQRREEEENEEQPERDEYEEEDNEEYEDGGAGSGYA